VQKKVKRTAPSIVETEPSIAHSRDNSHKRPFRNGIYNNKERYKGRNEENIVEKKSRSRSKSLGGQNPAGHKITIKKNIFPVNQTEPSIKSQYDKMNE